MIRKSKVLLLALAMVLSAAMLVGCNNTPAPPTNGGDQPEVPSPPAAPEYPKDTITWIVSRDPGDGQDIMARGIAKYLSQELGVNVVIKNVPGAGGRVGFGELNRAKPDGYTIGQDVMGTMVNFDALGQLDFPLKESTWFAGTYTSPAALWVSANSSIQTVEDLAAITRAVKVGETSMAGTQVPWTIAFLESLGVEYSYITGFEGTPPINMAILRDEVDMVARSVSGQASNIGDLKALVVFSDERHPMIPETPTLAEVAKALGQDDLVRILPLGMTTYMLGAPPKTPTEYTDILVAAMEKVYANPEFIKWAQEAKMDAVFRGTDEINSILNTHMQVLDDLELIAKTQAK